MKKLFLVAAIMALTVPLMAQGHPVFHEKGKKISDEITLSQGVKIGRNFLPAGKYRIECDHMRIVFINQSTGKRLDLPCDGVDLGAKRLNTELHTTIAPDGSRNVDKLYLRGSPVEHIFLN